MPHPAAPKQPPGPQPAPAPTPTSSAAIPAAPSGQSGDEQCYQHTSKCYVGPPAEAIRTSAREPEMLKWFDDVHIPPDSMKEGDVVVWRTNKSHCALAIGDADEILQMGVSPDRLEEFALYNELKRKRTAETLTDKEREQLRQMESESDPSRWHTEGRAKAEDLKKRGDYGAYTVYRIKPEYKEKYYTCKQLKKATRHFNWGDR